MYSIVALLVTLTCVIYEVNSWKQQPPLPDWMAGRRSSGHGSAWGGFGSKFGDAADIFDRGEFGHAFGDHDHIGYIFGDRGAADRFFEFLRHATEEHIEGALESGGHSSNDMEGTKKYSYFTQGSGPNGFYSRGYFGSNGYGHEYSKLAAVKDATDGAYRRGFESTDADIGLAHSAWNKHLAPKERRGFSLDRGDPVQSVSEHGKSRPADEWKSVRSGDVSDHHDRHCQQD